MHRLTSSAAIAVLCCLVVAPALPACGGGSSGPKRPSNKDRLRDIKEKELKEYFQVVEEGIRDKPLAMKAIVADCKGRAAMAREHELPAVERRYLELIEEARAGFKAAAADEVRKAVEEARGLAQDKKVGQARGLLETTLLKVKGTPYATAVETYLEELNLVKRAKPVYTEVIQRKVRDYEQAEEWEKAKGVLESFMLVEAFTQSEYAEEVKTQLEDINPKAETARERRLSEQKLPWTFVFNGNESDLDNLSHSDYEAARFTDGTFVFSSDDQAYMTLGEDEWKDYVVEMSVKIESGTLAIWVRGVADTDEDGNGARQWRKCLKIEAYELQNEDDFTTIKFDLRGEYTQYRVFTSRGIDSNFVGPYADHGPFMIQIDPGSEVEFKRIAIKRLEKE
ncbi:MAG: hypothetical protein ACYS22_00820 [Planctomycetota bacterium]|jgi:hypothetical protein